MAITKTEVRPGRIGDKTGFCFDVYWDDREYPNLISALFTTEERAAAERDRYLETGEYDTYGDAEL